MNAISEKIMSIGVVPVIKLNNPERDAVDLAKALVEGGVPVAEVTFRAAGAATAIKLMSENVPEMLVLPKNQIAILNNENCFAEFAKRLEEYPEIEVIYLVTDYESSFASMTKALEGKTTYQLYRDYLDNFRINAGRNGR